MIAEQGRVITYVQTTPKIGISRIALSPRVRECRGVPLNQFFVIALLDEPETVLVTHVTKINIQQWVSVLQR